MTWKSENSIKLKSQIGLENLVEDVNISKDWECIRENIKAPATESVAYYKLKQYKPQFEDECSKLLGERKQAKLQWLQNSS